MIADFYAVNESGYRVVTADMPLSEGESRVTQVPSDVMEKVRADQMVAEINQQLRSTDWTQMADSALPQDQKTAWAAYRQALRLMPSQIGFPNVDWPARPDSI